MTNGSVSRPAATPRDREFERRASLALKAVAVFAAIVALVLLGNQTPPLAPVLFIPSVLLYCATAWYAATRIDAHTTWALGVAPILMAVLVVAGVIDFLVAAQANVVRIPVGAVVAGWALSAPRSTPTLAGRDRRIAGAVLAVFVATSLGLSYGPVLAGPTGPFAVAEGDITLSLDVNCGSGSIAAGTVPITVRWSWARSEPLASGIDGVAIAWHGVTMDGAEEPFAVRDDVQMSSGVWSGGGEASGVDTQALVASMGAGVTFGVEVAEQHYAPGFVSITLDRANANPAAHGTLDVRALYSHAGRWRANSLAIPPCTW